MLDLVVVGGGPAGLATALAARRRGLTVAAVDRAAPPIDKACGEGLMPSAIAALSALGVATAGHGALFRGIRYLSDGVVAEASFPAPHRGLGLRRTDLHGLLVAAAEAAGVELHWRTEVTGLAPTGVATAAGELAARLVVGADGLRSRVRRWAGLERPAPESGSTRGRRQRRCGVCRHLALAPWTDRVEVYFGDGAEAYVSPLGAAEIGVAILWGGDGAGFDELVARRLPPELGRRLAGAPVLGRDRGAGPFRQRVRGLISTAGAHPPVALVGDAAGYVDAVTGEGLALAFESALALADALAAPRGSALGAYPRAVARLSRIPNALTHLTLFAARRPAMRRRAVAALARDPELFSRLLAALGAGAPLSRVGLGRGARFAASLVGASLLVGPVASGGGRR